MLLNMLKCKIHRAQVTDADLNYKGSITVDRQLMKRANILPFEKVLVVNINNGARFETYAIEGEQDEICVNGAAARLCQKGDRIIIMAFCFVDSGEAQNHEPVIIIMDEGIA